MQELHAILSPPRLERFRRAFGLVDAPLEARTGGYEKLVILSPEHAFLFPRREDDAARAEREHVVLASLGDLEFVPRPVARHVDPDLWPHPFFVTTRMGGEGFQPDRLSLDDTASVMEHLGRAIARWHALRVEVQAGSPPGLSAWQTRALRDADGACEEAQAVLRGRFPAADARRWADIIRPLGALDDVFIHGDICGGQILIDPDTLEITGVLDWGHAGYGHPLKDFDFGEWSHALFSWEPRFGALRERLAAGYGSLDWRAVHLFFALSEASWFADRSETAWDRRRRRLSLVALAEADRGRVRRRTQARGPVLGDGVVTLRPWRRDDAEALARALDDDEIARWLSVERPYTIEKARADLRRLTRRAADRADFAVVEATTGDLLGGVDLESTDVPGRYEAGWWLAARARGRGYATRAVRLLVEWAVRDLGAVRVEASVDALNEGSLRVAEAVFEREGTMRRFGLRRGRRTDRVWFGLVPPEPPPEEAYERVRDRLAFLSPRVVEPLCYDGEFETWEADRRWVARFARDVALGEKLQREHAVLARVDLPLPVPHIVHLERDLAVHEKLPGTDGERARPPREARPLIASQLGEMLSVLHESPRDGLPHEASPTLAEAASWVPPVAAAVEALARDLITDEIRSFLEGRAPIPPDTPMPPVVCHSDLKGEHVLLSAAGDRVVGVIDWADVCVVDPVWDVVPMVFWLGSSFARLVVERYARDVDDALLHRAVFYARCRALSGLGRRLAGRNAWPLGLARSMVRHAFGD